MSESAKQIGKEEFEALLQGLGKAVERFVKYKISPVEDAEDILQEIYLTAYRKRDQLKNSEAFRPWILSIAQNKCNDYYQQKAAIGSPTRYTIYRIKNEKGQEYQERNSPLSIPSFSI